MSKRFIVHGQTKLQEFEQRSEALQTELENSRSTVMTRAPLITGARGGRNTTVENRVPPLGGLSWLELLKLLDFSSG
jgi:hypothetical protein